VIKRQSFNVQKNIYKNAVEMFVNFDFRMNLKYDWLYNKFKD
jgi:hypothetical protein